jgi:acyl-coenzyme A synthetase/AMP-(fatty) acid ligase
MPNSAERALYTGDFFRRDEEGYLYFLGRKDDMIKSRGERVSPKEVENIICEMKDVLEAAVIPVPDEVLGQAIKAFVVTMPASEIRERDVLRHCTQNMETFMVPRYVQLMPELPKTPSGKIDKTRLKATEEAKS